MPPENHCHADCGILMSTELTFKRRVKRTTDMPSDSDMTKARRRFTPSVIEPPTMTGKSGRTQGASTVSTPAMNEIRRRTIFVIVAYFDCYNSWMNLRE